MYVDREVRRQNAAQATIHYMDTLLRNTKGVICEEAKRLSGPLEDMPLLLGDESEEVRIVARWRLEIGL